MKDMLKEDFDIIEYNDSYLDKIVELYKTTYNQYMNPTLWKWKYFGKKDTLPLILIALKNEQVIGVQASIINKLNMQGERAYGCLRMDVITHPEYRRKGVFSALASQFLSRSFERGASIIYSFPNKQSFPALIHKMKWHHVCSIPLFMKIIDVKRFFGELTKSKAMEILSYALIPFEKAYFKKSLRASSRYTIFENAIWQDNSLFPLLKNSISQFPLSVFRDQQYFLWRYDNHPEFQYSNLMAYEGKEPRGCLIYKIGTYKGVSSCFICELFLDKYSVDAGYSLLASLKNKLKENKVSIIGCLMLEHKNEWRILMDFGFRKVPRWIAGKEFYLVSNYDEHFIKSSVVLNPENWFLTWGDIDIV